MYKLELIHDKNCQRLEVGFLPDTVATNSELVKFVAEKLPQLIENEPMRAAAQNQWLSVDSCCLSHCS